MPKEIFVSYSSKDRATADAVLAALERSGSYQVRLSQKGFAAAVRKVVVRSGASRDVADVKLDLKRTA